jgi:hypothetical protein
MLEPVSRSQSPISTASPNPGQRRDPAQAPQPVDHRGVLAVGGHRLDRLVEAVPAGLSLQHGFVLGVKGHL